jgi:hypothetical protein
MPPFLDRSGERRFPSGLRRLASGIVCSLVAGAFAQCGFPEAYAQGSPAPAQREPAPSQHHQMISLVVLSNSYVAPKTDSLANKLDELYPGKFLPLNQQANFVAAGPTPGQFLIKSTIPGQAGIFVLISVPGPYTDFSDFAHFIADPLLRRKAEAQSCWLSVDLIAKITTAEEAYRFIGAVLAKLAPADAAVLVEPETNSAVLFDDELRRQLASGSVRKKD